MVADAPKPQGALLGLKDTEDPAASRERTDAHALFASDPRCDELLDIVVLVENAERCVFGVGDLARLIRDPLEDSCRVQLRRGQPGPAQAPFGG